jgi:exosortase family protein XrtF
MTKQNKLFKFILIFGSSLLLWFLSYEFYLKPKTIPDRYLTNVLTRSVCVIIEATGKTCHYKDARTPGDTYIFIAPRERQVIRIGNSCNGLELFVLFILFIVAYPGKWSYKIPFIFAGLGLIYIINSFRTYWLTIMAYYKYPHYDLFHRYIFIVLVYGIVFGLWMMWANTYSKK